VAVAQGIITFASQPRVTYWYSRCVGVYALPPFTRKDTMGSDDHGRSPELDPDKEALRCRVNELERTVQRYETERLQLQASYEEALQALADSEAKKESSERELKLAHDQISSMWKELESVRKKLEDNSLKTVTPPPVTFSPVAPEPCNADDAIELHCTLCKAKIKIQELDAHSKVCTSTPSNSSLSPKKAPTTEVTPPVAKGKKPLPQPSLALDKRLLPDHTPILRGDKKALPPNEEVLQVNVTRSPLGEPDLAPFKIITKTNLSQFGQSPIEVHRSQGDIQWLYEVLLDTSPERAVPPLKPPISLDATVSEFQRFLSRIAAHKVLKRHHMFVVFLSGTAEEMRTLRAKHRVSQDMVQFKPAVGRDTKSGPLVAAKEYLVSLEHHLLGLALHIEQSTRSKNSAEKTAHWFRALSESEPVETYLKFAASDLARTCESVEGHQIDTDDTLFIQSLQSIADYVKAAQDLLTRVEEAVDKFLYWDEEVSIMESVTSAPNPEASGDSTEDTQTTSYDDSGVSDISGHSSKNSSEPAGQQQDKESDGNTISERWAQASKYCSDAKDYLEMMCKDLSEELAQFDLRKETELKQVMVDYATAQLEKHEKFRGKWFAMKYLLDADIKPEVRAIKFNSSTSEATPTTPAPV
ncbi:hypothetical protein EMCRGX_G004249, partial [Ephydatia muelleri]